MKKTIKATVLLVLVPLLLIPIPVHAEKEASGLSLSAKAAFLYEAQSQTALFAKNEDARMPMASTTKIMTALAALSALSLDDDFCIPKEAVGVEGSSAYYRVGETVKIRDLFYALLLQSANDAAVALAIASDGSLDAFAARMNRLADEMGLKDTHFANPHGLPAKEHYTTARELAFIAAEALAQPFLREVVRTKTYRSESSEQTRVFVNHNKLLSRNEHAIGVKTGFTKASGRCLVGAAEGEGMTLISVTLCAPDDWADHEALWKYAFDTFSLKTYAEAGAFLANAPVMGSYLPYVTVSNREPIRLLVKKSDPPIELHAQIDPFPTPAPIDADTALGYLVLTRNGKVILRIPLYPAHSIPKVKISKK